MRVIITFILILIFTVQCVYAKETPSIQLSNKVMDYILSKHKLASEAKVSGKKLKISIMFNHNKATEVIHDPELVSIAKKAGIKRIEFYDWSGFSKEYLSTDIK